MGHDAGHPRGEPVGHLQRRPPRRRRDIVFPPRRDVDLGALDLSITHQSTRRLPHTVLGAGVLVAEVGVPLRGMDGELQEKLEATQRRIHICLCGALTGGAATDSVIARTSMEAAARAAATATNSSQSPADVDETVNDGVNGTGNVGGPGDSTAATANASSQAPADVDETVNAGLNGTEHIGGPGDSTAGTAARTTGGADEAMLGAAAVEADGGGSAHEHDAGDGHWYDDNSFLGWAAGWRPALQAEGTKARTSRSRSHYASRPTPLGWPGGRWRAGRRG